MLWRRRRHGAFMSDSAINPGELQFHLQKVAAYRELCRGVRRSGRENIGYALAMFALVYFTTPNNSVRWVVLGVLVGAELFAGLFKLLRPSAEGFLLDALVLVLFAAYYLFVLAAQFQRGGQLNPLAIFFTIFFVYSALGRVRIYRRLSRVFAERPTAAHLAWFDDLFHEIVTADPHSDEQALDLPTKPHWKAKLLGETAFFVTARGKSIWVAGPDEFEILREKTDHGTGSRRAVLRLHNQAYPTFKIGDATWDNYQKWRAANPNASINPSGLADSVGIDAR
jgi:hypothetical protein